MKKKKWLPILVVWLLLGGVAVWGLSQFVTEQIWKSHNYIVENPVATVMIDPGHGGYDSGAVAADGTMEKDVALALALQTGEKLHNMDPSIQVIFTRYDDNVSWPDNEAEDLQARVAMAINYGATHYLAIHCNSAEDPSALGHFGIVRQDDVTSQRICQNLDNYLAAANWGPALGFRKTSDIGSIFVVDQLGIPSMLFETGFLSNPTEAMQMRDPGNQDAISTALAQAYYDSIHGLDVNVAMPQAAVQEPEAVQETPEAEPVWVPEDYTGDYIPQ
ncbi:N-acetylmuramoyl-L-alanine amidase family protein [Faecalibaculum rodentium]|jgi:N-acetylmuramoyl-L-alanine amidase|uniref:MurNAc-LAA domain-containing protein n=6 Tax=Faecalibaculum rodentium TaxID=1702221 RepID=A0A140DZ19_9FIRM|nr:N-acetylmuramoyl-L-alanine amidase [Faecalibaculum rodentium]AMK55896.1 hypothetical protein AALO17_27620 [Faecalibaculum rodentium]